MVAEAQHDHSEDTSFDDTWVTITSYLPELVINLMNEVITQTGVPNTWLSELWPNFNISRRKHRLSKKQRKTRHVATAYHVSTNVLNTPFGGPSSGGSQHEQVCALVIAYDSVGLSTLVLQSRVAFMDGYEVPIPMSGHVVSIPPHRIYYLFENTHSKYSDTPHTVHDDFQQFVDRCAFIANRQPSQADIIILYMTGAYKSIEQDYIDRSIMANAMNDVGYELDACIFSYIPVDSGKHADVMIRDPRKSSMVPDVIVDSNYDVASGRHAPNLTANMDPVFVFTKTRERMSLDGVRGVGVASTPRRMSDTA